MNAMSARRVEDIPIELIDIPEKRARSTFTPEQHEELKASIKNYGFTVPILVARKPDGRYELIDGEHRLKVAQELGYEKVPAVVVEADTKKAIMLNVLANTARGTQNPMDVAEALKRALDAGATEEELAAATGHTVQWVKIYLSLNELPDEFKEALRDGRLKIGHIREALRLPDGREMAAALDAALSLGWDVKTMKYYVDQRLTELAEVAAKGMLGAPEPPPSIEEAARMVSYGRCTHCGRNVPRDQLYSTILCRDCLTLLDYVVKQLGTGKDAMALIFEAVSAYVARQKRLEELPALGPGVSERSRPPVVREPSSGTTLEARASSPSAGRERPELEERVNRLEEAMSQLSETVVRSHQVLLKKLEDLERRVRTPSPG